MRSVLDTSLVYAGKWMTVVPSGLEQRDCPFVARPITASEGDEFTSHFHLRHDYFVADRGWVRPDVAHPFCETDEYDSHCHHLGVFENEKLVAYLRVLPSTAACGFMLDHEFRCLLSEAEHTELPRQHAVELSRLVVAPDATVVSQARRNRQIMELLLKLLYKLSLTEHYEHFYIEVEASWLQPFMRRYGLPFTPLGAPYIFPDGTETVLAHATLENLERAVRDRSLAKYEWYRSR